MAEKILKYYQYINNEKGLEGKQLLAKATKIPSILASTKPDTPEVIEKFRNAVEQITGKPAPKY